MITSSDIADVSDGTARRIIAEARSIAPCLDSLEGEPQKDAIAILQGIAKEVVTRGSRDVKSQRIGPAQVEYFDIASAFRQGDRDALRALCSGTASSAGPVGSFPIEQPFRRIWPECQDYT